MFDDPCFAPRVRARLLWADFLFTGWRKRSVSVTGVLVHEWLTRAGGSENVFATFCDMYPAADVVCLWNDDPGRFSPSRTKESWMARSPLRRSRAAALPLMPFTWRHLPFGPYDWALISSHAFAHQARFKCSEGISKHVYVHSPARYVWEPGVDGRGSGMVPRLASSVLRPLDRRAAQHGTTLFAANSAYVKARLESAWRVDAVVIHPPVSVEDIQAVSSWSSILSERDASVLASLPPIFVLGASRFIPYKRLDLVIETGEVLDVPVVLAGAGPGERELRVRASQAQVPVVFVRAPSTPLLRALYERCMLYVFPALEDFGLMPVEASATGAPVLALPRGGTAESIEEGVSGAFTTFRSAEEIRVAAAVALATDTERRRASARRFSTGAFVKSVESWVGQPAVLPWP